MNIAGAFWSCRGPANSLRSGTYRGRRGPTYTNVGGAAAYRYLELGSIAALVRDLDERHIRTKRRASPNGTRGEIRFGLGPLAHPAQEPLLQDPVARQTMKPETRDALLSAVAKARGWIDDLIDGRIASFADNAAREGKVERHVRLLAPLAFTSPRIIAAIVQGIAPAELTVTGLAKSLPLAWPEQERRIKVAHV
jgi:hypothetical protein